KAVTIYEALKKQSTNPAEIPPFTASSGWFCRFKNRYNFHNVRLCAEAGSADVDPAQTFPIEVQNLVKEKGYCLDQIFNFDETNVYLKRMPKRSYISREHRHATGICAAKDRVTVMLGANASGDLKLKPLVIHRHANLRALRGIVKSSLGVYYRYSKRGWMTAQVCLDIFSNAYANDIKKYLNEKNLAFKVLVITDSASSHPPMIAGLDPNVHFVFLPARTTSLLQPLDQGVIGASKAYYLRRTFKMLIDATDGENCETVMEFWKNYNLRMAIDNIVEAWNDVSKQCLHRVWRKLIPDLICDFKDFEPSAQVCEITESCVQLANRLGFEEVEYQDIEDILNCQPDELTTEELQELSVAGEAERREEDDENQEAPPPPPRQMTTAELSNTLETIEQRLQWLEDNDCNAERSGTATRGPRSATSGLLDVFITLDHLPGVQLLYFCRRPGSPASLHIWLQGAPLQDSLSRIPMLHCEFAAILRKFFNSEGNVWSGSLGKIHWLGFEEMEYQDVKDILNCPQDELTTNGLQWKQKEEKRQILMKIRKLLRENWPQLSYQMLYKLLSSGYNGSKTMTVMQKAAG
ncbi:hypothetical protein M514_19289, partial [Trichuris suis]